MPSKPGAGRAPSGPHQLSFNLLMKGTRRVLIDTTAFLCDSTAGPSVFHTKHFTPTVQLAQPTCSRHSLHWICHEVSSKVQEGWALLPNILQCDCSHPQHVSVSA
eukprot:scaffold82057_cov16-Tisochrysis_lutea.AAC.1